MRRVLYTGGRNETLSQREDAPYDPEVALRHMLPAVAALLKDVVEQAVGPQASPTLYELEALTQRVLPQIGQVVLRELTRAQGSGLGKRAEGLG